MNSICSLICFCRTKKAEKPKYGYCLYDVWRFCLCEPLFEGAEEKKQIIVASFGRDNLYCHKQLLTFHSPFFASENYVEKNFPSYCDMYDFLQFAHGVRYKIIYSDLKDFFVFAKKYQLPNVTQLLEQKLILEGYHMNFKTIFAYDLNHQLAMRLKRMKNSKELAEKLKTCKIEKMSGEAIKQCVKFFFEH